MKHFITLALFLTLPVIIQGVKVEKSPANPIANIIHDPGLCGIFHTWGFIGDSLCSGEHEYHKPDGKKGYKDLYDYSWGQRICAYTGTKGDNYSQGGETAHGWIEHFWDKLNNRHEGIDAKKSPKQAYIMALGVNDSNHPDKNPIGSPADIDTTNYKNNKDTYYGNYAGIIQRVRSIAPDCKIFVVTMPLSKNDQKKRASYNEAVRYMAKTFKNVYLMDLEKYAPLYVQSEEWHDKLYVGSHLNAMGYEYTAWMFINYINWIIQHNWNDFKQVAFINTEYKY